MREFAVGKNDANQRLDKFLLKMMPCISKNMLYKSLRKNCVKINGRHIKDGSVKLLEGDILSLYFADGFFEKPAYAYDFIKISPSLDIIYEDENLLIINKPQGVLVHEDEKQNTDNLLSHIKSYLYKKGEYLPDKENTFAPALANRIDRGTGGIVLAAKNAETLRVLNEKIKKREIKKFYLCLAYGHFREKEAEIRGYILRDEKSKKTAFSEHETAGAKETVTAYRVLEEFPEYSLLEIELKTGRTHQIRAVLAYFGHSLLGDRKYTKAEINRKFHFSNQALCAYKIEFDFKSKAGLLEYLGGRIFEVKDVKFR